MSNELDHLLDTNDVSLLMPVFTGVHPASILAYDMTSTDEGPILTVQFQLQDPIVAMDGKEFPAGHIINKQIRFIETGKWTIESAKQEVRKLQVAALQKPYGTDEALPALSKANEETYVGQVVQLHLKPRPSKNKDGEVVVYQDCRIKALPQEG